MVVEKYLALQTDEPALKAFMKEQKAIASKMMKVSVILAFASAVMDAYICSYQHAEQLIAWEVQGKRAKALDDNETMQRRKKEWVFSLLTCPGISPNRYNLKGSKKSFLNWATTSRPTQDGTISLTRCSVNRGI
jgi:hypothetical protein